MAEEKGDVLVAQAEKKLSGFSFFGGKKEEAMEMFEKAAAQYKIAKAWEKAGDAYLRASDLAKSTSNDLEYVDFRTQAAHVYKKTDPLHAIEIYESIVLLHRENNRSSTAAKLYKTIAELYEAEKDFQGAAEAFSKSADCYSADNAQSSAGQAMLKVAHYAALQGDYSRAVDIYEEVAHQSLDNSLLSWGCKEHYLKATLCLLAMHAKEGKVDEVEAKLEEYLSMYPAMEDTRESQFLQSLIEALRDFDLDKFNDAIFKFDSIAKLDDWKVTLLLSVKRVLRGDVPQKEAEEDEEEFLG